LHNAIVRHAVDCEDFSHGDFSFWLFSGTPIAFWAMHAGIAAVGGLLTMLIKEPLKRALTIS
jgi:hypothetical protein